MIATSGSFICFLPQDDVVRKTVFPVKSSVAKGAKPRIMPQGNGLPISYVIVFVFVTFLIPPSPLVLRLERAAVS